MPAVPSDEEETVCLLSALQDGGPGSPGHNQSNAEDVEEDRGEEEDGGKEEDESQEVRTTFV